MLPLYIWVAVFVGRYHDKPWTDPGDIVIISALVVLGAIALIDSQCLIVASNTARPSADD